MTTDHYLFRAIWPILDETVPWADLVRQASDDLPEVLARAHARILRPGRFSLARSETVPGSGRVAGSVLVYEAPAVRAAQRPYWASEVVA